MSTDTITSPMVAACAAFTAAVDALQAAPLVGLPDAGVVTALETVETQARRLPTVRDALVAEVHTRSIPTGHGHRSTSAWLRDRFRVSGGEARCWLRGAERLTPRRTLTGAPLDPVLPVTAAARAAGVLSAAQVKVIDDLDDDLPAGLPVSVRREIEQRMVRHATQLDPTRLARLGQHLLDVIDPDGAEPSAEDAHRRRGITIGPLRRGLARISGHVDAWTREAILAVLNSHTDPDPTPPTAPAAARSEDPPGASQNAAGADPDDTPRREAPDDTTPARRPPDHAHPDDAGPADSDPGPGGGDTDTPADQHECHLPAHARPVDPDRRTYPQRLHDALRDAFERLLASGGLPHRGGTPATILLTVPLTTLEERTGLISTANGGDIPTSEIIRRAGDTAFIPIVLDTRGNPLYMGRRQRLATRHQRYALHIRDGGCVIPGCTTPSPDCHTHHLLDWADGGRTDITNLALLCAFHHYRIKGWTLELKNGRIWCTPPPSLNHDQTPHINTYFREPPPEQLFE